MTAVFITATGTDIGKTFLTAGLIRHIRGAGGAVAAIKPIVSGFDPGAWQGSDPAMLLAALGRPVALEEVERISPWRFKAPLSPHMAGKREGRLIVFQDVVEFCRRSMAGNHGVLLIEGVGGIMTPLDGHRTTLDVMMALQLPVILVSGTYRGAISHTLTALDSLFRRDMNVLATIVSETPASALPLDDVVSAISRFTAPVIGLPRTRV